MTSPFSSLPAPLSQALADKGYETLTPVQAAILDPALIGKDLLVSAQTGSGKTVAFGMAMSTDIMPDGAMLPPPDSPRALVIAPTRELALQVRREFEWLWGKAGVVMASCVGGMDVRTERRTLERGAHIVVGTPGRLRDHIERGTIDLSAVQAVTLDEADEMLDLGFREDLEFILKALPEDRRTLLFSATVPKEIEKLARTFQRDAQRIATTSAREAHADIAYRALTVAPQDTENAIVNLLRFYEARNALVFCKTRVAVNHLTARLLNRGFSVVPLSGELAQEERARALQAMRDGRARVCVATDVAARGIDLPGLELVIHADVPSNPDTLLHRSGRTGRAGNKGVSALIVPMSARRKTERLLATAKLEAEWGPAPSAADVSGRDTERLLSDEALTKAEDQAETPMITQLTEKFDTRALAAAVLRLYFAARSAPEDVAQISPDGPKPRAHSEFGPSHWVRVAAGHTQSVEPRWLLPMMCRAGNLTKDDIGAIRIFDDHTLVQLLDSSRERFEAAMGSAMQLEQGINVTPAAAPAESDRPAPRPRADSRPPRKPYGERDKPAFTGPRGDADGHASARPPRPSFDDKPRYEERAAPAERAPRPVKPRHTSETASSQDRAPQADATERPARKPYAPRAEAVDAPARKAYAPRPDSADRPARKPYAPRPEGTAERPARKPYAPRDGAAERSTGYKGDRTGPAGPRGDKPSYAKPRTDRPSEPRGDAKPAERARMDPKAAMNTSARMDGKPARKAPGKPFGKPAGKFTGKPGAKPSRPRPPGGDSRPKR